MLFLMAHDDPHELQNARFAVVFTRAQIQTTRPASKADRALIQIIEVWQWSGLLGAFVTVFSDLGQPRSISAHRRIDGPTSCGLCEGPSPPATPSIRACAGSPKSYPHRSIVSSSASLPSHPP
jgi:hypothetical protein